MKMTVTINEAELKEIVKNHLEKQNLKVGTINLKITRGFDDQFEHSPDMASIEAEIILK